MSTTKPKAIKLTVGDDKNKKEYILEYDRDSIIRMADEGFSLGKFQENTVGLTPLLFQGAFYKRYKWMSAKEIKPLWDTIPGKEEFIGKLIEMYSEQVNEMYGEPDESKKGMWEVI